MNWPYLLHSLQHLSPAQVAARYAYRGVRRALELDVHYAFCLTPKSVRPPTEPVGKVEYGFVDEARLRREARDPHSGLSLEALERSLSSGELCFGAFIGDVLVCQLWLAHAAAHLAADVYVHFDPRYAYARWAFTRAPYRGLHLHARCKSLALQALAQQGRLGILSVVSAVNFDSLKSARRVGCTKAGVLFMTRAAERQLTWSSPSCARYGLRLERHFAWRAPPRQYSGT